MTRGGSAQRAHHEWQREEHVIRRAFPLWPIPLIVAAFWLLIAHTAVVLVDVRNLAGLGDRLAAVGRSPLLFPVLFENQTPTEFLQWALLGILALVCAYTAGEHRTDRTTTRAFLLVAVLAVVMLIEDAGDVRQRVAQGLRLLGVLPIDASDTYVTVPWFALLGGSALAIVLVFRSVFLSSKFATRFGVAGGLGYGLAASMSAAADVRNFYHRAGTFVETRIYRTTLAQPEHWWRGEDGHTVQFFVMDQIVEESIELMAAALLVAAVLAWRQDHRTPESASTTS